MITLYSKDFSTKYGVISSLCEAFVEEERNGLFELSFIMLNTDSLFKYIKEENIVVTNANDTLLNQKFRIYMTRKLMNNRVEVFARHISFDLMYDYIDNLSFENQSCEYALNQLFRNSNFSTHYRGYSDIVNAQNYNMSMANVLEAIGGKKGSIVDTFGTGAEILRDNENIHVLNKRGYDNEVTIEYKKNLTGFELEEDTTDLVTRISPYAKYNDSETNEEIIVKADYVDSPLIANYSHPYIKAIDYSDKFGDGEIPTVSKLQDLARKEYKNNKVDMPKQNFKIEFIPLSKCVGYEGLEEKISLCDTVTIIDTRYNINTQAKVIKVTFNVLKNRYESMELGEPRTSLGDIIGSETGNNVTEDEVKDIINSTPSVNFPNTLPPKSILKGKSVGLASIELNWTFENKNYYSYELYASKTRDFTPNSFYLIHEGQTSSYLFQAKPNETWYFKVCAKNSHGNRNAFSDEISVSTAKIDANEWIEEATIGNALIGELSADKITSGTISGHYIDARNLSVTDGNGKRTLDIDSFGNIHIKASSFSLQGKNIATEEDIRKTVKSVDVMYYLSTSQTSLTGGTWTTTAPTWVNGKYMWSKTVTTYTDGTNKESSPTCIAGAKGDTGLDGVGVSEIIEEYYLSTSNTSQTGGTWTTSVPTWSKGKFIWTRSKIIYTNGRIDYTTPICDSTWQAIDQQTSEDVFNKLTDNGNKQGLYMQDNQLYVNGQYVNAKNLKVVNNEGTKTLDIDSFGNVSLDVANFKLKSKNVALEDDINNLNSRVSSAEQKITDKAITSVVQESEFIKDIDGKISTNKSNISKVEQTASEINSTVSDLSGRYTELKQTVSGLTSTVADKVNSSDISSIIQQSSKDIQIGFNGINDRININPTSMDFRATNNNRDMSLYGGQVCIYNNANDTFMSTMGSVLKADTSYKGVGFLLGKNANIFTIGRDATWTDVMTNRSPNPIHYITFNFGTNQADIDMELNTNRINMRGNTLRNSSAIGTDKLQTNSWYALNDNPLFTLNSYWGHIDMYQDLEANYNAILNARLVNPQNSYAISSGYNVDVKNDADVLIANEKISTVSENGEVNYDINEMIKLLYSKIHTLEKEIESLKGGV